MLFLLGGGVAFGMIVGALQTVPEFEPDELEATIPSIIKGPQGDELTTLDREHQREEVSLDQVPDHVVYAFMAIEDARFDEHFGFDVRGISRAAVNNLQETGSPFRGSQGGSTITQQLVKNTFLSPKRLLERKIHEAWLALHVERTYTKDEVMEFYLNYATYFYHNVYGIQAASNFYFDKDVSELTVEEGAMLAGIIRHPNRLSPHENPDETRERQETVLYAMKTHDFLDESKYQEALGTELDEMVASKPEDQYPYPHFVDYVLNEEIGPILEDKVGETEGLPDNIQDIEDLLYHHGLTIHTTVDRELQGYAEDLMENPENFPETWEDEHGVVQPQGALVVAEPDTGQIRAMVGGRDYGHHNMVNRVTSHRSPGSAMKPINVYAPAIEEGLISPGTVIDDEPTSWDVSGDEFAPENFTNTFRGLTTVRESLVDSLNIPAVKVYDEELNLDLGIDYARDFGISTLTDVDEHNLAAAIGGLYQGVEPIDLTKSYSTLANEGIQVEHHTITKIEDRYGNVIYEQEPDYEEVISEQTSWLITDILQDVVSHGTAASLNLDFPVAAKTGTSNNFRDAWLMGYTPNLVAGFWLGHDEGDIQITNRTQYTTNMIESIMSFAMEDENPPDFEQPSGIEGPIEISEKSGKRATEDTPSEYTTEEYFLEGQVPTDECDMFVEKEVCLAVDPDSDDGDGEPEPKLATDDCPDDNTETQMFLDRDEPETTNDGRTTADEQLMPPEEECNLHDDGDLDSDVDVDDLDELDELDEDDLPEDWDPDELDEDDLDEDDLPENIFGESEYDDDETLPEESEEEAEEDEEQDTEESESNGNDENDEKTEDDENEVDEEDDEKEVDEEDDEKEEKEEDDDDEDEDEENND